MKITSLTIDNFMAIGHVDLPSLDTMGLTLLQGENRDDTSASSNGAGKSSIVDALAWCLYGYTARGEEGDNVINRVAGKGCLVTVALEDEAGRYQVSRGRKHKALKNGIKLEFEALGGKPQDLTKGTNDLTQKEIDKILGCPLDVFTSAIYAGQEAMPDLPGMTDKNLKLVVEEAAGITRLEEAHRVARNRLQSMKALAESKEAALRSNERAHADTLTMQVNAKQRSDEWVVTRGQEVEKIEAQITLLDEGLKASIEELNGLLETEGKPLSIEMRGLREKLAGLDAEKKELAGLETLVASAAKTAARAEASASHVAGEARHAKAHLDGVSGKVGTPCGECGKSYAPEDMAAAKEASLAKLVQRVQQAREVASALNEAKSQHASALSARDEYARTMTDASASIERERVITKRLDEFKSMKNAIDKANTAREAEAKRLETVKLEPNPHVASLEEIETRLATLLGLIAEGEGELTAARRNQEVAEAAAGVFSPTGVRGQILDSVTPYLNDRTSHYLGVLSDGNIRATWTTITPTGKGEAREKFSIQVENTLGGETFKSLSGGEKRKVRLATAMALQDLVASRATKPISLFIADEIDHALDEAGLERLMTILEEKAREKGTVMVVSHQNLKSWIRNVATIIKEGGRARVELTSE